MKQIVYIVAAALTLAACATPASVSGTGGIRMSVRWPEPQGFTTKVIPARTQSLEIIVSGQGLSAPKEQTLTRAGGDQQTLELELPAGPKRVVVRALSETREILADGEDNIEVRPGQTSRLELSLRPMAQPTPSPDTTSGNSGTGSTPDLPGNSGGQTGSPSDPASPDPQTPVPDPATTPAPGPSPSSGVLTSSGGGGSSSGSSSGQTAPTLTDLTANPQTVTGLSYPSEITAVISDPSNTLQPQHFQWSCTDSTGSIACNNFTSTDLKNRVVWQAPAVPGGPYNIKVEINDGVNPVLTRTVQVTVQSGTGTLNGNGGALDGGQAGAAL